MKHIFLFQCTKYLTVSTFAVFAPTFGFVILQLVVLSALYLPLKVAV